MFATALLVARCFAACHRAVRTGQARLDS